MTQQTTPSTMAYEPAQRPAPEAARQPIPAAAAQASLWQASATLWRREMVRFFRQRNRVIGSLATPLVIWLMLGLGFSGAVDIPAAADEAGVSYQHYFFPGIVSMMLLFTAIFATISVIEDRREGFMQAVVVAPVPRTAIVLGKVLGGASIATIQGLVLLVLWQLLGPGAPLASLLVSVVVMFVLAMGLTALGLCLAWPMDSTAGFHAIMNLFLMPMWVLSGAVFPLTSAPVGMRAVMWANPMTYGQTLLSSLFIGREGVTGAPLSMPIAAVVLVSFVIATVALATRVVSRRSKDGMG